MLCYLFYLVLDITIISTSRYDYFNMHVMKFTLFDLTIFVHLYYVINKTCYVSSHV